MGPADKLSEEDSDVFGVNAADVGVRDRGMVPATFLTSMAATTNVSLLTCCFVPAVPCAPVALSNSSHAPGSSKSAARRQPRRTAGRGPPHERRVPPAGAVAEVIREKGPTCPTRPESPPPTAVPGPLQRPAFRTGGGHHPAVQEKESPRTTEAVRHHRRGPPPPKKLRDVPHAGSPEAWRGGRRPRHAVTESDHTDYM
ncbi:unnamed protein product [Pleuronectes platessa]|uniref:Uncharacterized protein n=1 Tax=Pleuronectes platessa TaxID=8262 RepID=A0A9N7YRN3_PLEPL|nr:unnamed protein product [Pleuronectes platessa]